MAFASSPIHLFVPLRGWLPSSMRSIAAHYLLDQGRLLERPVVRFDEQGRVLGVEQWQSLDSLPSTEFYAGALCAGFVNAHCHLELSYLRGAIEQGTGFGGFAAAIGRVRGSYDMDERLRSIAAADAAMWEQGVQAVGDIVNGTTSYPTKSRSQIIYRNFAELFGLKSDVDAIAELLRCPDTIPTPHSIYSLQDNPFRAVATMAGCEQPLSVHFMESDDESALFRGEGSLAAWYERMGWQCDFLHYGSPATRLVESLDAKQRLLLVHACCVTEQDVELIDNHFEQSVAWVLCPRSNRYISGLQPPLHLLRRKGALICVGTDSLASNDSLSIIEELKMFSDVPLAELVAWATINGARALGLEQEIGSVERGKRSGLVLIEGVEMRDGELCLRPDAKTRRVI